MQIVAHRGIHQTHPENSLEAFMQAWASGFTWCECDVHASRDGVPVIIHDPTLDRTTDHVGPVGERDWSELKDVRLESNGQLTDCRLPTLEAVMEAMPAGCAMLVEVKPKQGSRAQQLAIGVTQIVKDKKAIIQSFDPTSLYRTRALDREREHVLLVGKDQNWDAQPWDGINFDHTMMTAEIAESLRRQKKKWGVWTVNQPIDAQRIFPLEPDVMISDDPAMISRVHAESSK